MPCCLIRMSCLRGVQSLPELSLLCEIPSMEPWNHGTEPCMELWSNLEGSDYTNILFICICVASYPGSQKEEPGMCVSVLHHSFHGHAVVILDRGHLLMVASFVLRDNLKGSDFRPIPISS